VAIAGGGAQAWEPDSATLPDCPAYAKKLQYQGKPYNLVSNNNSQVLGWKSAAQNQFEGRAHVQGAIVRVYPDRNGHHHFAIQIGPDAGDTVEIVYNEDFGPTPPPAVGMQVEACGDYITSVGPSSGPNGEVYPASPDGALVHWVHMAPPRSNHTSGYLVLGGVLTGQEPEHR
jgi:hypothetical protein